MKRIITISLAFIAINVNAQWWDVKKGNGKLKKETREVGSFSAISSGGSWDVMINYGESNSIEIEADENLLEYIKTSVEEGKLKIYHKDRYNIRSKNKITIYVSMKKITALSLAGSGDIIGNGNFYNEGRTKFAIAGSGNINLNFKKMEDVQISIAGSGDAILSGESNEVGMSIAGSGSVNCTNLIADGVKASIAGSGSVKCHANKTVKASIVGSGSVYYKGGATDISKSIAGSGRVKLMN